MGKRGEQCVYSIDLISFTVNQFPRMLFNVTVVTQDEMTFKVSLRWLCSSCKLYLLDMILITVFIGHSASEQPVVSTDHAFLDHTPLQFKYAQSCRKHYCKHFKWSMIILRTQDDLIDLTRILYCRKSLTFIII